MKFENKQYYVYIMTNKSNTTLYTGMTNNLLRRIPEHKSGKDAFTKKYRISKLVYFEYGDSAEGAILREKQIKAGSRQDKINLIISINPGWNDLYDELTA
jgi:putative endonuclease